MQLVNKAICSKSIFKVLFRGISRCLLLFIFLPLSAQQIPIHPEALFPVEFQIVKEPTFHSSIFPYRLPSADSSLSAFALKFATKNSSINFTPILTALYLSTTDNFALHAAGGIKAFGNINKIVSFGAQYAFHYLSLDSDFYSGRLLQGRVIPHYGRYSNKSGTNYSLNDFSFYLAVHPSKYIDVEAGIGKHHIGDGYRSLFLSANSAPYPYLKTSFHFWKVHYFSMVTSMRDYLLKKGFESSFKKYISLHYLSWNITKRLNVNLFEAVIWETADTLSNRSLDIHYLNPVIFYRPLEYNLGSPDNVVMGVGSRFSVLPNFRIYGQFLLDEFYLKEIKAGNKWWGNKYAYQLGFKIYNPAGIKPLTFQAEYNQARPYTYAHHYPLQNYGNWLQPLAHPLGSNFREAVFIVRYGYKKWFLHARSINSWQGFDSNSSQNIGADIYKSSLIHDHEYNNQILQGKRFNSYTQEIKLARMLVPSWGLQAELTGRYQITQFDKTQYRYFITFGLRTLLFEEDNLL